MSGGEDNRGWPGAVRLIDENEQLRTQLEAALEENSLLVEERDRQHQRLVSATEELQLKQALLRQHEAHGARVTSETDRQDQAEEGLRAAFEEMQMLSEELEAANSGLFKTNQELDARVEQRTRQLAEINSSLQATEASLRAVADLVPDLLWRADADGHADWFNKRWLTYTGRSAADWQGLGWLEALHPRDRDLTRAAWNTATLKGSDFERELRVCDDAGDFRWFLVRAEPVRNARGAVVRWFAAATDIHAQRMALESLQRSEMRFRTLIEGMPQLVWRAGEGGLWTWCSAQWTEFTGQDELQSRGMGWLDAFHPDDREGARRAWAMATDSPVLEIVGRIFNAGENRYRHARTRARAVLDTSGEAIEWIGTSTDVDDIVQLQQAQSLLVAELQHRTRNLMAVVQLVTARTLRTSSSLEEFGDMIGERLSALARVQSLLARRETGARLPFDRLIREELAAHVDLSDQGDNARVVLDGPAGIPLRSSTVQTLALALHELSTNAVKYGALGKQGRLQVSWGLKTQEGGDQKLWVDWRETGVAEIPTGDAPAKGGGFGRELIERALPYQLGASTTYELTPEGVHCTIQMPITGAAPDEIPSH